MAAKLESRENYIERKLKETVESLGGICRKVVTTHESGWADRECLLPGGVCVFVELKAKGKRMRKLQELQALRLKKLGFEVLLIDSIYKVKVFKKRYERK